MKVFVFLVVVVPIVYGTGGLLGAPEKGDVNNPEIQEIANFALDELNKNKEEHSLSRTLQNIESVKTQIVAGVKYMLVLNVKKGDLDETCEVTVLDVPWMNQRNITKNECRPTQTKLGGEKAANKDEVQDAIRMATDYHNSRSNSIYRDRVHSVGNIKKQTVAGILFTFTLTYKSTNCFNDNSNKKLDECAVNDAGRETQCTYKVSFQAWQKPESQYTVQSEKCLEQHEELPGVKSDMITNLKNLLKAHKTPKMEELLLPNQMLPGLGKKIKDKAPKVDELLLPNQMLPGLSKEQNELSNRISPVLKRKKKSVGSYESLMQHIGKSVYEALKNAKKENPDLVEEVPDMDKLLGKDGHDLVKHGLDKLLGGDGHDLLKHGIQQLLGGDGHDLEKHGFDKLLGGDDHDLKKHGGLIGGDDHDSKKHGGLIGGDDHDFQKHGGLIGGGDHDYQNHGSLIGGGDHDYQKHGSLIGGDDHDSKKHGGLIGGDDHDGKLHDAKNPSILGGDGHDLCHLGHFKEFITKHGKSYETDDEEKKRFGIFCENMALARHLNKTEQGTAVYGATKFADLTQEEFRQMYLSKKNWDDITNHAADKMWRAKIPKGDRPTSFDWRDKGAVTPVKNQGQCGSCWAFSTTGNIEGQWKINRGNLISLSEQELVDCDKLDDGCDGGLPSNAYESIMKLGGLETEGEYKYEGEDEKCVFNKSEVAVTITGAVNISSNEDDMASWLAQNGPISIGINANAMQFYFGGISHPWKIFCNPSSLDHGVLIVGYGVEGSEPFWIIKNSWGPDWGEKGYYRVYRGGGVCGLNRMCTSAVVN